MRLQAMQVVVLAQQFHAEHPAAYLPRACDGVHSGGGDKEACTWRLPTQTCSWGTAAVLCDRHSTLAFIPLAGCSLEYRAAPPSTPTGPHNLSASAALGWSHSVLSHYTTVSCGSNRQGQLDG